MLTLCVATPPLPHPALPLWWRAQLAFTIGFAAYQTDEPNAHISTTSIPWDAAYYNCTRRLCLRPSSLLGRVTCCCLRARGRRADNWHWPQMYGEFALVVSPAVNGPTIALWVTCSVVVISRVDLCSLLDLTARQILLERV